MTPFIENPFPSHGTPVVTWKVMGRFALMAGCCGAALLVRAPAAVPQDDDPQAGQRADRLAAMRQLVAAIDIRAQERAAPLPLVTEPLLRFDDPARAFHDGTLWALGREGRPVALIAVERYEDKWSYELISLHDGPLTADLGRWTWKPRQAGLSWQRLADAPAPARTPEGRLIQLRRLAREFEVASSFESGERHRHRVLPQPLYRYASPDEKLVEGAVFAYVHGTNPEAVVLLECRDAGGSLQWHCAFARLTTAAISARRGETTLWSQPSRSLPETDDPYTYFTEPLAGTAGGDR